MFAIDLVIDVHKLCCWLQCCWTVSGGFDCEEDAARAHDVMAIKSRGLKSSTNYDHKDYEHLLLTLENLSKVAATSILYVLSRARCT